jgi:hypothetical protein
MLMPSSASVSNMVADTPGWLRMPAPTSDTLAMASSVTSPAPISGARAADVWTETGVEIDFGDGERDVGGPVGEVFCTIMSTLTSTVGQRPEEPGGDAGPVGHPGDGDLGLRGVVGHGGDDGFFHVASSSTTQVPGSQVKLNGRAAARVIAGELDRAQHQDAAPAGGDLEHLLEADPGRSGAPRARSGGRR